MSDTLTLVPKISIIIPTLNEEKIIEQTLSNVLNNYRNVEVIVVDGGSQDNTVEIANNFPIKVITAPFSGRAKQMNLGANIAAGDIFLFLHADTLLPLNYSKTIREILVQPEIIAGAFSLKIAGEEKLLRLVEIIVNWRSQFFSLPYGDQGIFCFKNVFKALGGFPDLPIMEDFEFVQRLKDRGKIAILADCVITSARRWQKLGIFKTTAVNQLIILGYYLGISPQKLRNFYREFK